MGTCQHRGQRRSQRAPLHNTTASPTGGRTPRVSSRRLWDKDIQGDFALLRYGERLLQE